MMTDNDVLKRLDWQTITCQCEIHDCRHHCRRRQPCTDQAIRRVEFHAIDNCNDPELGEFGNHVALLCVPCLMALARNVTAHLKRLNKYGRATCLGCGAPVAKVDDVIREIEELK